MPDGVGREVLQHLFQPARVAVQTFGTGSNLAIEPDAAIPHPHLVPLGDTREQPIHGHGFTVQDRSAAFEIRP